MSLKSPYDRLLAPIYVPSFLMALSAQAMLILLPLYVLELGGAPAFAALIMGLHGIGILVFDIPAGMLAARFGDKPLMLVGLVFILAGTVALSIVSGLWMLAVFATLIGVGSTAWVLGRLSYITDFCPPAERGRAIAVMAGVNRMGGFIGPVAGGIVAEFFGYSAAFFIAAISAAAALILVFFSARNSAPSHGGHGVGLSTTGRIIRDYAGVFATAGFSSLTLQLMRATRNLLVPLFGVAVGLDAVAVGAIFSFGAAVDMSLFYPVGIVVDRWGRKWTGVPSMILFAIGLSILPLAQGFYSLLGATLLLGFANGVSTGIVMIIGSDLAPSDQRGQFLGVWRLVSDVGWAGGPLLASVLAEIASLAAVSFVVSVTGIVGAFVLLFLVPETLRSSIPDE